MASAARIATLFPWACCRSAPFALAVLVVAGHASGQTVPAKGFAVDRLEPSERGSDWFVLESLDLRGENDLALGMVFDWAHRPLVVEGQDAVVEDLVIRDRFLTHLGGAWVVGSRARFGLNLPLIVAQSTSRRVEGDTEYAPSDGGGLGDLRVGFDVRIAGEYRSPFTLAAGSQLHLATGAQDAFASDGRARFAPRVLAAAEGGPLAVAAKAGLAIRPESDPDHGGPTGSEFTFGVAGGVRVLDSRLLLGAELFGSTLISQGDRTFDDRATPLELLASARFALSSHMRAGVGLGSGFTQAPGVPKMRFVASLEWVQAPMALDQAGAAEIATNYPFPQEPDWLPNPRARDLDGDGVADYEDACPGRVGPRTSQMANNGCPVLVRVKDADHDLVEDDQDACPKQAGPQSVEPARNGCPLARIEGGQIRILDQVEFDTASPRLLPASEHVLAAVARVLHGNKGAGIVTVEGHSDNRGTKDQNLRLSKQRAESIVKWLTDHGVDRQRLVAIGVGSARPVAPNDTPEGRARNRRVEFHISSAEDQLVREWPGKEPPPPEDDIIEKWPHRL